MSEEVVNEQEGIDLHNRVVNGVDVEQAMLDKEKVAEHNPEDIAAALFNMYLPKLLNNLNKMSAKAMRRILATVVAEPFHDLGYKFRTQVEKETAAMARALLDSKYVMVFTTLNNNQEALVKASDSIKEGEANVGTKEET